MIKTFIIKEEEYDILYSDQVYNIVIFGSNDENEVKLTLDQKRDLKNKYSKLLYKIWKLNSHKKQ